MIVEPPFELRGPPALPVLGHLLELQRDQLGFLERCARDYGDLVLLKLGSRPVYMLNHPDLVEQVLWTQHHAFAKGYFYRVLAPLLGNGLLTSEGDFWLRQRRLAQPAFHRARVAAYAETMVAFTREMLDGWADGEQRDVHDEMMRLTLRVVGKTLFDADVLADAPDVGQALPVALRVLNAQMTGPELLLPPSIPTPNRWRLRQALRRLDPLVFRIIAERRASGEDRGDLLSSLLAVRDEDGSRMTDQQLRDEAMTIVLAGHETTALALTWTWYLLSQHPQAAATLRAELDSVLGGRPPEVGDVERLPYAAAVLAEAMRLYPPIFAIGRETTQACEIGGQHLPAGSNVYLVLWVLQRDPRVFDEPHAFRPERWLDGLARRIPRGAYFPFGGGPRLCIGQGFAQMEATLLLASIAQRFELELPPGTRVAPLPALTTRPRNGLPMRLRRRP